jgi:hypothetical protein
VPSTAPSSTDPIVPFKAGSQTNTNLNDEVGGSIIFLDRHNVNCGAKPLNQLKLNRSGNQIQWKYTCADGGKLGSASAKNTPGNDDGGGKAIFLDRHDADCGEENVMTQIQLHRPTDKQIQWKYACAPNTQSKKLTCRKLTTNPNEDGGGNVIFLDRHDMKCNENEAISRIKLKRPDDKNYQFEYTCCS